MSDIILFNWLLNTMGRWDITNSNALKGWFILSDDFMNGIIYYGNGKRAWKVGRISAGNSIQLDRIKRLSHDRFQFILSFGTMRMWSPTDQLFLHTKRALGHYFIH